MRIAETKKFSDGRDATAFLAYCERRREGKRADGDVHTCVCGAEIWVWNRAHCSEKCRKVAIKARHDGWKRELERLISVGLTVAGIQERLGIREHAVRYRLGVTGIQKHKRQPQNESMRQRKAIVDLREQGVRSCDIAKKLNLRPNVVHGHLYRDRMKRALARQGAA